jgi:ABC-2 type transport system ATP-binding protein
MLLGLLRPTSGSIHLFGQDVGSGGHHEALRRIGAIVETPVFYPYLSGRQNLRYFVGISPRGDASEVERLLKLVGLSARADSKYSAYSLGMKQRLGVARALIGDPELVLLDEPTNGLDPAGMAEMRDLIRELGSGGRTVLLCSHLLHEVEQVCQEVAILSRGRLITQGLIAELRNKRSAIQVKTTDDAKAKEVITSLPWVARVTEQQGYLIVTAPPDRSSELSAALMKQGVLIQEMSPVQFSLEQYFLEVTGENTSPDHEASV